MLKFIRLIIAMCVLPLSGLLATPAYAAMDVYLYGTTSEGYQIQPTSAKSLNVIYCLAFVDNKDKWRWGSDAFQLSHCRVPIVIMGSVSWDTYFNFGKSKKTLCKVHMRSTAVVDNNGYVTAFSAKRISGCEDVISSFKFSLSTDKQNLYMSPQLVE